MPPRWKSTDEAISSLHAATAQLQHDATHRSATLAQLLHNTTTTNATLHSCQIYLRAISLQLAQLQSSSAHPPPFLDTAPSNSISAPATPLKLSTFDDSTPPSLPREFPLLKPSSTHQTVGLTAPLQDQLRPPPSISSPSLLKQSSTLHAISVAKPTTAKSLEPRISHPPPQSTFAPLPPLPPSQNPLPADHRIDGLFNHLLEVQPFTLSSLFEPPVSSLRAPHQPPGPCLPPPEQKQLPLVWPLFQLRSAIQPQSPEPVSPGLPTSPFRG